MSLTEKEKLKPFLKDYLIKNYPDQKLNKKLIKCLACNKISAQLIDNKIFCHDPECNQKMDIFDLVKTTQGIKKEEDIIKYIKDDLKVELIDTTDELLNKYYASGFYLFPLSPSSKIPLAGFKWKEESVHNKEVWKSWVERGYGLGLMLGKKSNVIAWDIDSQETYEKIKHLIPTTLTQSTKRGNHYLFNYDADFDAVNHANLRDKGYEMEIRANNSYIAIAPTSVEGEVRKWNNKPIISIPHDVKKFFLDLMNKESASEDYDDVVQNCIDTEKLDVVDLSGKRNDTFVKTAGIFSKWMPKETVEKVLGFLSHNWIDKPLPNSELRAILGQIKKYRTYDKELLAKLVLERLEIIKEGTAYTLSKSLNLDQQSIENVLNYLEREGQIICLGKNRYKRLEKIEWSDNLTDESQPINFSMPYFDKYCYLNYREIAIIGAVSGSGKTVISANIVKQLNDQKVIPYIISTESTSTLAKTFHKLNIKPGQYKYKVLNNVLDIELPDNSVVILDWLSISDGDYSKVISYYAHLYSQVVKHNSFLIVFEQLRKDGTFFCPNQNLFYASLGVTYHYGQENDYINTFFKTHKIRDSKQNLSFITIPTIYSPDTREVKLKEDK